MKVLRTGPVTMPLPHGVILPLHASDNLHACFEAWTVTGRLLPRP